MSDQINLIVSATSVGVKDLSKDLDDIVKTSSEAAAATTKFTEFTKNLSGESEKASKQAEDYLAKITMQAETMGRTSEFTMAYISAMKGATDIQQAQAAAIGAEIDAYRNLAQAQAEAIAEDEQRTQQAMRLQALNLAGQRQQELAAIKALTNAQKEALAEDKQRTLQAQRMRELNLAGQRQQEIAAIKAEAAAMKEMAANEQKQLQIAEKMRNLNMTGQRQQELAAIKAKERATLDLQQSEKEYLRTLEERAIKIQHNTEVSAASIAKERGYSQETIAKAKLLGKTIDEETKKAAHGMGTFDASILRSGGVTREYMVLLHELAQGNFSRLGGSLMVMAERLNATQYVFSATGLAVAALAGTVAFLTAAFTAGYAEDKKFRDSLLLTGTFAGITKGEFNSLSHTLETTANTGIGTAKEALQGLISSGKFTDVTIAHLGATVVELSKLSGKSTSEITQDFASMSKGVTEWAYNNNETYHFLSLSQYKHIEDLEKEGRAQEAMQATADALGESLGVGIPKNLGYLDKALDAASHAWSSFWNSAKQIGMDQTTEDKIEQATKKIKFLNNELATSPDVGKKAIQNQIDSINQEIIGFSKKVLREQENATAESYKKQTDEKLIENERYFKKLREETASNAEKRTKELAEYDKRAAFSDTQEILRLQKIGATESEIANARKKMQDQEDRDRESIKEKYKDKKPESTRRADTDKYRSEIEQIQSAIEKAKDEYTNTISDLNNKFKIQEISKFEVIAETSKAEQAFHEIKIAQINQEIALAGKQKLEEKEVQKFKNDLAKEERAYAQSRIDSEYKVSVEVNKMEKDITQLKIKELDAQGRYADAARLKNITDHQEELDLLKRDIEALQKLRLQAFSEGDDSGVEKVNHELDVTEAKIKSINKTGLELVKEAEFKQIKEIDQILKRAAGKTGEGDNAEKSKIKQQYEEDVKKVKDINIATDPVITSEKAKNDLLVNLEKEKNKELAAIDQARVDQQLASAESTAASLVTIAQDLFGKQSTAAKAMFAIEKTIAIARSVMSINTAMAEAWSLPFPANLGAIATVAAGTASIISNIMSVKGYESGGYTGDTGTSQVAGVVHGQEFVVNAAGTRNNRALLEAMNSGQAITPVVAPQLASRASSSTSSGVKVHVENHGTDIQVRPVSEGEIRIIAKQIASSEVKKQTPEMLLVNLDTLIAQYLKR